MGDDITVRRLVEILSAFYTEERPVEEDLSCSLTNEFLQNIQIILLTKQSVILHRWKSFLHVCGNEMLYSSQMYLRYVFHFCRRERNLNFNIFEKFLGVFALIIHLNVETLKRTEVNFCKLIPDIFMAFYSSELKEVFYKRGGFHHFAKYINNPDYISLKSSSKGLSTFCNPTATVDVFPNDLPEQMEGETCEENDFLKNIIHETEMDRFSLTLAQNILNSIKIELPLLPSNRDSKIQGRVLTSEEISELPQVMRALEAFDLFLESSSKTDSEKALEALDLVLESSSSSDSESSFEMSDMVQESSSNSDSERSLEALGVVPESSSNSDSERSLEALDVVPEKCSISDSDRALEALDMVLDKCSISDSERALTVLDMVLERSSISDSESSIEALNMVQEKSSIFDSERALEAVEMVQERSSNSDSERALEGLEMVQDRSSNSDSKTSDVIEQMADKTLYKNIIEAVIRYNHSKSSGHEKVNNRLQKKAYEILQHLKYNIESLIGVLDEYDKE